jgi:molybdenum cofactor cytidylyltransferase
MDARMTQESTRLIAAVVLAAGLSSRMGRFKLTLPWDGISVIGWVVETLGQAGLDHVVVVTGHRSDDVAQALTGLPARLVHNPNYTLGGMLSSIQVGLLALRQETQAALICLGDQPQMEVATVRAVLDAGREEQWRRVIVPSFRGHAGHPVLLPSEAWPGILATAGTLREFMRAQDNQIRYVDVNTSTVLDDLDTPSDYKRRD